MRCLAVSPRPGRGDRDAPVRAPRRRLRRPSRWLAIAPLSLTLLMCGEPSPSQQPSPSSHSPSSHPPRSPSGVKGVVVLAPTCPVEGVRESCGADPPVRAHVRVREDAGGATAGATAAAARTGADGRFSIPLPPRRYVLVAVTDQGQSCKPVSVTVTQGRYTPVTLRCETGIR